MEDITNLLAIPGDRQVTLTWVNPIDGDFSKVEVSWSSPVDAVSVMEFSGLPGEAMRETITGLTHYVTYTFTFKTIDDNGNKQNEGRVISIILKDVFPPGDITELSVIPAEREVFLNWKNPSNSDFSKVEVSWSSSESGVVSLIEFEGLPGESMSETITGLVDDVYVFTFKTIDGTGNKQSEGRAISTMLHDIFPPGDITELSAIPAEGEVSLSWVNPSNTDFAKVEVSWSAPEDTGSVIEFEGLPGASMSETITGLLDDITYNFTFKTIDSNENKQVEGKVIPIMLNDTFPPGDITELFATPAEREISLSWKNPSNIDFSKVEISYSAPGHSDSVMEFEGSPGALMSATITELANDVTYTFTFKTIDFLGNKQVTGQIISVSTIDDVTPPQDVTNVKAISSDTEIKLWWQNPADSDFSKVKVSWTPGDAGSVREFSGAPGEDMRESITGLTNGTMYTFTIKSIDIESNEQSTGKTVSELPIPHWGGKNHIEYGVRWHPLRNYPDLTGSLSIRDLDREVFNGISYVHFWSNWGRVEPSFYKTIEKGFTSPDLRQLINWVDAAHAKGLKIHLELKNYPNWVGKNAPLDGSSQGERNCCDFYFTEEDRTNLNHFETYVTNMAKLFVGKVQSYSIFAEANINFNWKGEFHELMEAMTVGARAVRRVYDAHELSVSISTPEASPCWSGCNTINGLIGNNPYERVLNMYDQFIGNEELMSLFDAVGISMNDNRAYGNMRILEDKLLGNGQPGTAPGWELIGVIRNKLDQAGYQGKDIQVIESWVSWDDGISRDINGDNKVNEEDAVFRTIRIVGAFLSRGLNKINLAAVDFFNPPWYIGLVKQLDYRSIIENLKGPPWVYSNSEGGPKIINRSFQYKFDENTSIVSLREGRDLRNLYADRNNPNHPHYYIWKWYSQIASGKDEVVRHAMQYRSGNRLNVSGWASNGWRFRISSYNVTQNSFIVLIYSQNENGTNTINMNIPSKVKESSPFIGRGFSNGDNYRVEWETKNITTSSGRDTNVNSGTSPVQTVSNDRLSFTLPNARRFTTLTFRR